MCHVSSPDTTTSDQMPPALEPAKTRFNRHRRSFATSRVILALVLREMSSTYGRSPGGYIWAILEPLGMIIVLSFGFSLLMKTPSLGNSFILFYASGYLIFSHYKSLEKVVSKAISFSRRLLYYPAVTWLDAIAARFILNLLTNLLNMILLLGGILFLVDPNRILNYPPIILAIALASFLGLGIGTLNSVLSGLFPVWNNIWKIATRPLMIASAVIFIPEDLPQAAQNVLWWNPLVHLTGMFRMGVFTSYHPQYVNPTYVFGIALVTFAFGLLFLRAYHSDILNME